MSPNNKKRKRMISTQSITHLEQFTSTMSKNNTLPQEGGSSGPVDPKQVAEYCEEILTGLRDMAHGSGHTFLAYLIQVAVEEAKIQASGDEQS
jgi:hypothetical protein